MASATLNINWRRPFRGVVNEWRFTSIGEFNSALLRYNISVDLVRGVNRNGERFMGLNYSATDSDGRRMGSPIHASKMCRDAGIGVVSRRIDWSEKQLEWDTALLAEMKSDIANAMFMAVDARHFTDLVRGRGLDVAFQTNKQGRIYGVTFFDLKTKSVLKGSRLGKQFSANVFHEIFSKPNIDRRTLLSGLQQYSADVSVAPKGGTAPKIGTAPKSGAASNLLGNKNDSDKSSCGGGISMSCGGEDG